MVPGLQGEGKAVLEREGLDDAGDGILLGPDFDHGVWCPAHQSLRQVAAVSRSAASADRQVLKRRASSRATPMT